MGFLNIISQNVRINFGEWHSRYTRTIIMLTRPGKCTVFIKGIGKHLHWISWNCNNKIVPRLVSSHGDEGISVLSSEVWGPALRASCKWNCWAKREGRKVQWELGWSEATLHTPTKISLKVILSYLKWFLVSLDLYLIQNTRE